MKSLVDLVEDLLLDCSRMCGAPVDRDVKTLRSRVKNEGDSFITITLPSYCKDFERSLADGRIDPGRFLHFRKKTAGMPAFLSGFLFNVFDRSGVLLVDASVDCIRAIRQICLIGKKVKRPCTKARASAAIEAYAECDQQVNNSLPDSQLARYFKIVAKAVMTSLDLVEGVDLDSLVPSHGPGATREGVSGNQKFRHRVWHERMEAAGFSYLRFGHSSQVVTGEEFDPYAWPSLLEPSEEPPVRVVLVPKTLKTPRIIAIEPVCMQYMQQALFRLLVERIRKGPITRGRVNFNDQTINQRLAIESSIHGRLATMDMKEASDRVSYAHARELFASTPELWKLVDACRSTRAELPSGEVISLAKFASMGSALCFPVEALVFFITIIASRVSRAGRFPHMRDIMEMSRDVYVFGDDLIVPSDEAPAIRDDLEAFGFLVNSQKSFWTGSFRESCGMDAYLGYSVKPVYLREDYPTGRGDVERIVSLVATANQLSKAGYARAASGLREVVERITGALPVVPETSPAIGWYGYSEAVPRLRWNPELQRLEIQALVPVTSKRNDAIDGVPALVKCLLSVGSSEHGKEVEHLLTSPRQYSLALKRRWVSAS